jgi:hypothetical protein
VDSSSLVYCYLELVGLTLEHLDKLDDLRWILKEELGISESLSNRARVDIGLLFYELFQLV